MPVVATTKKISNPRTVLTDLKPGRTRETIYAERSPAVTPLVAFLIGLGVTAAAQGIGRTLAQSGRQRAEAREFLKDRELLAKIQGDREELETIQLQNELLDQTIPLSVEQREIKVEAARKALPLDLTQRSLELDKIQQEIEQGNVIFPLVQRLREEAADKQRSLTEKRQAETLDFLDLTNVRRERAELENDLLSAQIMRLRTQTDLLAAAADPFRPVSREAALVALGVKPTRGTRRLAARTIRSF